MDIQTRKIKFVQEFLKLQSEEVISRFEKILKKENVSSEKEEFKAMSIEEFNSRIDQSMGDSKDGNLISSRELKAKIEEWN
jgi:hypothetical protein